MAMPWCSAEDSGKKFDLQSPELSACVNAPLDVRATLCCEIMCSHVLVALVAQGSAVREEVTQLCSRILQAIEENHAVKSDAMSALQKLVLTMKALLCPNPMDGFRTADSKSILAALSGVDEPFCDLALEAMQQNPG